MNKFSLKNLLVATNLALALTVSPISSMEDIDPGAGQSSWDGKTFSPGHLDMINQFRAFYQEHGNGHLSDNALGEHQEFFVPYAKFLLETMKKVKQTPYIVRLATEVERALEDKAISAHRLVDTHFRYLALLEDMLPGEMDIFLHVPHNKYLMALLEKDIHGRPAFLDPYQWGMCLDRVGEHVYSVDYDIALLHVAPKAVDQIDQELAKHMQAPIIYPSLGEGIFPVELILNCWFDYIFLIGMPTDNIKDVHGEDATPLGFAFHDLFHFKLDSRRNSVLGHIADMASDHASKGGFVSRFIPRYVPIAVKKYNLIMSALKRVHDFIGEDRTSLLGEFITLHEQLYFPKELLHVETTDDVLKIMLMGTKEHYSNFIAWENPEDPLMTSPVTGESKLSLEEIKEWMVSQMIESDEFPYPYDLLHKYEEGRFVGVITDPQEIAAARMQYISKLPFQIHSTPQFIDGHFELHTGDKFTVSVPTLVRKVRNLGHTNALLQYAGFKPVELLDVCDENRTQIIEALGRAKDMLMSSLEMYQQAAENCLSQPTASHDSMKETFVHQSREITAEAKQAIHQLFEANNSL